MNKLSVLLILLVLFSCVKDEEPKTLKSFDMDRPSEVIDYSVLSVNGGQSNHGSIKGVGLNHLYQREIDNREISTVITRDKSIYYIDLKGFLVSIDLNLERENWRVEIKDTSYFSPIIMNNSVYLLSLLGDIYIVDCVKGEIQSQYKIDKNPVSNLILVDEKLFLIVEGGYLLEISGGGEVKSLADVPESDKWIYLDNKIYIAEKDYFIRVYNLDGTLNRSIESGVENIGEISSGIGLLAIGGNSYEMYDLESNTLVFRDDSFNWTAFDSNEILLAKGSGTLKMITRTGFTKLWETHLGHNIEFKPLIIGESLITTGNRYLSIIDRISGEESSSYNINTPLYSPVTGSDLILITSGEGLQVLSPNREKSSDSVYREIVKGINYSLPLLSEGIILEFNPKESGDYNLYSDTMSTNPVEIEIIKSDGSKVAKNIGYTSYEEGFINRFDSGTTYYIHCRALSKEIGDFNLEVK